jgi:hypothetical protein
VEGNLMSEKNVIGQLIATAEAVVIHADGTTDEE